MSDQSWFGFQCTHFTFEDRDAIIVFPKEVRPGSPWVLKTEYWDAFPDVEVRLLKQGFHVAYVQNKNRWFTQEECDAKARFVRFVSQQYNLNPKCVPVGMSCGGGYAVKFGGMYPELIKCMYIDAPVLNFCSIPGRIGGNPIYVSMWEDEFVPAYGGIKHYQLPGSQEHPICQADSLVSHKIPVLLVYGTEDTTVIYEENGKLLEDAFAGTDLLTVIDVPYRGHHPHGIISGNQPIVDFILAHS